MSSHTWPLTAVLAGASVIAMNATHVRGVEPDATAAAQLTRLASMRVFFGHQSVGQNVLDGLNAMASEAGKTVMVVETKDPKRVGVGTFAHALVGNNGDPSGKLDDFDRIMRSGMGDAAEVAFMKFCYVDFRPDTDVAALFERYQSVLRGLQATYPRTKFVHFTVPLTSPESTPKALVKRVLGRRGRLEENAQRERYNSLVRRAYEGREPLFDLARLESTRPDGRREAGSWNDMTVPMLVPDYTTDGAHLDARAGSRIARALVDLIVTLR